MRLHEITEGLDGNQRRVGQVGAEEKASSVSPVLGKKDKQHPFKGRLVGEQGEGKVVKEFAPAGNGNPPRGPKTPGSDPWGGNDGGEDPYGQPKPEYYPRSSSYFEKFEADHFDKEDFDDATGVFKGYWENDNGSFTQIGYFKFDDPTQTGGDDPGMGWYYEPNEDSDAGASVKPAVDDSQQRKQQELSMINAFLKSGQTPKPGSQIYGLMKKHGMVEGVAEAINPDITNPEFSHQQQIGDYLYVARYWSKGLKITAYDGNKKIGYAELMYQTAPFDDFANPKTTPKRVWLESEWTNVDPKYQRQGIMSTMYAYAKMLGNSVKPSQTRSDDAKAAWKSWRDAGDAKYLTQSVDKEETEYGPEWDEKIQRLKKLAGMGPLKTVWDPVKRVYKNVPVNQKSDNDQKKSSVKAQMAPGIKDVLKTKGYKYVGHGQDQDVFIGSDGWVLKVFGWDRDQKKNGFTRAQQSFIDFANFCKKNAGNEFLPNFSGWTSFKFRDQTYLQIRCERLFPLDKKWPTLGKELDNFATLVQKSGAESAIKKYVKVIHDTEGLAIPMFLGKEGLQQFANTLEKVIKLGQSKGYSIDLHSGNFMFGSDGQIVINDPFFTGSYRGGWGGWGL